MPEDIPTVTEPAESPTADAAPPVTDWPQDGAEEAESVAEDAQEPSAEAAAAWATLHALGEVTTRIETRVTMLQQQGAIDRYLSLAILIGLGLVLLRPREVREIIEVAAETATEAVGA